MSAKPVIKQIFLTAVFVAAVQIVLMMVFGAGKQVLEGIIAVSPGLAGGISGWVYLHFVKNSNMGEG